MNLNSIIREVGELSLRNGRLNSDIKGFVNRAQRSICARHNFNWMKSVTTVTVPSGSTSAPLDETFKELTGEKSPISYTYDVYRLPVVVVSREQLESSGIWPWVGAPYFEPVPGGTWPIRIVFLEWSDGVPTLNIPSQFTPTSDITFNVSAYYYPEDLALGTDHNGLTDGGETAEALINRTKAIAYFSEDPSDARGLAAQALYEAHFTSSLYSDEHQRYAGRTLHL